MKAKYGEKEGLKNYDQTPSKWDRAVIGMLALKVEFWAYQYDFSFQLWGPGNNNAYIMRGTIDVHSSGGFETVKEMMEYIINWCEKANPRVKYPKAIWDTD